MTAILAFFPGGAPGFPELIIFGTIALLLFGKRLPEVARSLGKGIGASRTKSLSRRTTRRRARLQLRDQRPTKTSLKSPLRNSNHQSSIRLKTMARQRTRNAKRFLVTPVWLPAGRFLFTGDAQCTSEFRKSF
jgi:Sec-independent protein translocase protein TatA